MSRISDDHFVKTFLDRDQFYQRIVTLNHDHLDAIRKEHKKYLLLQKLSDFAIYIILGNRGDPD